MAKTSIYLPDDLAEQVRAHGIAVSEVAQDALRRAVSAAEIKENVMTDVQAVADRLNAAIAARNEAGRAKAGRVRAYGAKWARTTADARDLEYVATYNGHLEEYRAPVSLIVFISSENEREHREAGRVGLPGPSGIPTEPETQYWDDLQAGAREVWEAVQPLLTEPSGVGDTPPSWTGGYAEIVNEDHRLWLLREPSPDASAEDRERWMRERPV